MAAQIALLFAQIALLVLVFIIVKDIRKARKELEELRKNCLPVKGKPV